MCRHVTVTRRLVNYLVPVAGLPMGMLAPAGVLKTFLGLSASVMTTIYVGAFEPNGAPPCPPQ